MQDFNKPRTSILLPVYNMEKYVGEAIQSTLDQIDTDFELLISDNASTDRTVEVIETFRDPRIQFFKQESNIGMALNWDFLLQKASGRFACILGADDRFNPDHLSSKIPLFDGASDIGIVHGPVEVIGSDGKFLEIHNGQSFADGANREFLGQLLRGNPFHIGSVFVRMDIVREHNLHFDSKFPFFPDWRLWIDVLHYSNRSHFDPHVSAKYRVHPGSQTAIATKGVKWSLEAATLSYDALVKFQPDWGRLGIPVYAERRRIISSLLRYSAVLLLRMNSRDSRRCFGTVIQLLRSSPASLS